MDNINIDTTTGIDLALYYMRQHVATGADSTSEKTLKIREHILKYEYANQHQLNGVLGEKLGKKLVQWLGITTVRELKTVSKEYIATLRGEGVDTYTTLILVERIGCIPFKPFHKDDLTSWQYKKLQQIHKQIQKARR